jgi:hypothetical protein
MNPVIAMITKLGAEAATKAAASPIMKLGSELAAGNVAGGIEGFAQNRFGPQMEFGRAMMDPNASGIDAFMKMRNEMPDSRPAPMQMAGIPQLQADPLAQMPTGSVGMQNQRRGMPMAQGLPQGLLAQLGYRG